MEPHGHDEPGEPGRVLGDVTAGAATLPESETSDTIAEVDAAVRTQRRLALGYAGVFLVVTAAGPALTLLVRWWTEAEVLGGMSPSFAMAAVGLYVAFFTVAVAAARVSDSVEERMLGDHHQDHGSSP